MKWHKETPEQQACEHEFVKRGDLKICVWCHTWRRGVHLLELVFLPLFLLTYRGTGH